MTNDEGKFQHGDFNIRKAQARDAEALIGYSKRLFAGTDQLLTTVEEYNKTVDEQVAWINESLQHPSKLILIAEIESQIVGLLFFGTLPRIKIAHTGEFGVSVDAQYRSRGIGRALIENLILWAKSNPQVEKIFLQVFASNVSAIKLYSEMGFIEEGRHIKAIKQKTGEYTDIVQMYMETKL